MLDYHPFYDSHGNSMHRALSLAAASHLPETAVKHQASQHVNQHLNSVRHHLEYSKKPVAGCQRGTHEPRMSNYWAQKTIA